MAINGVAQEFWSEVLNLHAPLDEEYPRAKAPKLRAKRIRRAAIRKNVRLARAS
jgi:hypothetical protein